MNSNYPPGHPVGNEYFICRQVCPNCNKEYLSEGIYERDTNATTIDDFVDKCDDCGEEMPQDDWERLSPQEEELYDPRNEPGYYD